MGPIRGVKRKKKAEKKPEENGNASCSSEKDCPLDLNWWDEFSKRKNGFQSSSKFQDNFKSVFRVSRKTFDYICSLVKDDMMGKSGNFVFSNGKVLSLDDQVAVAMRRLSSGDSLVSVGDSFGLNHSTVSQVTWRFVESMEERGIHHLHWPSNDREIAEMKYKFEKIRGLPNCCGAIGTTRITMCLAASDPTSNLWLDQQKNHTMILQAIVDPEMRFLDIVTGWPGKMEDSAIFQNSNFYKLCNNGERLNGKAMELSKGSEIREYIIGDSAFPLLPYLITPYNELDLSESKTEFNERHSATRVVAERALARLKEKWRIINGVMWRPDKHRLPRIILVCCLLHNIALDMEEDEVEEDGFIFSRNHGTGYGQLDCETFDINGAYLRDKLSLYLSAKLLP